MSGVSRETLELIASWAEILTAAFGILAATGAVVYLLANKPLKKLEAHDSEVLRGTVAEAQRALLVQKERADLAAGKLAGLEQDVSSAKTEMAKQQTRAATAERNLLELQERVKLRRLSPEQKKKLLDFLHTPAALAVPKGPIRLQRLIFDETAQPFALEIKEVFAEGGWPSDDVGRDMIPNGGKIPVGIVLIFHDANQLPAHAGLIQHALKAAGIEPALGENPNVPEGMVEIMVGIKP